MVSILLLVLLLPPVVAFVLRYLSTSALSLSRSGDTGVGKSCLLSGFQPVLVGAASRSDTLVLIH